MSTVGRWLGSPQRPLFGWLSTRAGLHGASGVLVLPAVGYQYWSSYRTVRVIAERLALAGHTVLRVDYDGSGDSAGEQWDPDRVAAWRASAAAGAEELRALGCTRLTVLGVRLGGTLALTEAGALGADAVAAWEPIASGRRYVREIRLLATDVPEEATGPLAGAIVAAGVPYTAQTLADIDRLSLASLEPPAAPRVLIVGEREDAALVERLRGAGAQAESIAVDDGAQALGVPAEDATVAEQVVAAICDWVGPAPSGESVACARPSSAEGTLSARARVCEAVSEQALTLGPDALVGILSEPAEREPLPLTVVFLNSGSEPHIGSGRAWVEYARGLAAVGYRCLRVDFRGWGESPDGGHAPGRPYDQHGIEDAVNVVRALRARGHDRVVLLGLCAGAWIALRVALSEPLGGVIALNPQMYWRPGDPVEALMSDTRLRRTPERRREERGRRIGLWSALDLAGHRPWAARWLDGVAASRTPVAMVFAEGDDGIEYLRNRVGRRLDRVRRAGIIRVVEVPEIDHSMHRIWLRGRMLDTLREQLRQFASETPVRAPAPEVAAVQR